MSEKGKIVVISAPSGCGKSTIINSILGTGELPLRFSVSATNRAPRQGEQDGVNYHFLTTDQFRDAIAAGEFVEWEQVYPGRYYGTLRSELTNAIEKGEYNPTVKLCTAICRALGKTLNDLFWEDEKNEEI